MDFSLRKNIPFGGKRVFELSIDIFNPFNFVQWSGDTGGSGTLGTTLDALPAGPAGLAARDPDRHAVHVLVVFLPNAAGAGSSESAPVSELTRSSEGLKT